MKKQRGQAIVEFALILPMFMILLFGAIVSGFLFSDYMTLSNIARSSARESSVMGSGDENSSKIREKYNVLNDKLFIYEPDGDKWLEFERSHPDVEKGVTAIIKAKLKTDVPWVGVFNKMTDSHFPPSTYEIRYTMRDESDSTE